uniref:RNA-directed RNA polymerase L n=1 Tax=Rousettus bat hantavirus TaxID=3141929 RepID=A0AAU7E232_9VIRU
MEKLRDLARVVNGVRNDSLTMQASVELIDNIYRARHDAVEELYCESHNIPFEAEKPMADFCDINGIRVQIETAPRPVQQIFFNKTPDIIKLEMDGSVSIIEFSVSNDIQKSIREKENKYMPLVDWLNDNNQVETRLVLVCVSPSGENVQQNLMDVGLFNRIIEQTDVMVLTVKERKCRQQFRASLADYFRFFSGGLKRYTVPRWEDETLEDLEEDPYEYDQEVDNFILPNDPKQIKIAFEREYVEFKSRYAPKQKVSPWCYFPDVDIPGLVHRVNNLQTVGWVPDCWEGNLVRRLCTGLSEMEKELLMYTEREYRDYKGPKGRTVGPETLRLQSEHGDDEHMQRWHVRCGKQLGYSGVEPVECKLDEKVESLDYRVIPAEPGRPKSVTVKVIPQCQPSTTAFKEAEAIRRDDIDEKIRAIRGNGWINLARQNSKIAWWLTCQMGERRARGWSVCATDDFILVKAPAKSILKAGAVIKFFWICKKKTNIFIPVDMVEKEFDNCVVSKLMTVSSKKVGVLEGVGERCESLCLYLLDLIEENKGLWQKENVEELCRSTCLIALGCSKRMSGILDNARYMFMQARADWSGILEMISGVLQPTKNRAECEMQRRMEQVLMEAIEEPSAEEGETVVKKSVGFLSRSKHKFASLQVEEVIGAFFLVPKGMHGIQENINIMKETDEYANKFEDQVRRYGEGRMLRGFKRAVPCRSGFNRGYMYRLGHIIREKVGEGMARVLSDFFTGKCAQPYFLDYRNNSTKSLSKFSGDRLVPTKNLFEAIDAVAKGDLASGMQKQRDRGMKTATRLVRKFQRTAADRGIFIPTQPDRIYSYCVEALSLGCSKYVNEESISRSGDLKATDLQQINAATRDWKNRWFFSIDYTKWSPGDNGFKFAPFLQGLFEGLLPAGLLNDMKAAVERSSDFDFYLPEEMLKVRERGVMKESVKDFFLNYDENGKRRVRGNWKQGMFNYTSSLVGVAVLEAVSRDLKERGVVNDIWFRQHSDDCLLVINLSEGHSLDEVLESILKYGKGASLEISRKKTYVSQKFAEFVGMVLEGKTVRSQTSKFVVTCSSERPGTGFLKDVEATLSMVQSACRNGLRLNVGVTIALAALGAVRMNYSMGHGLKNSPEQLYKIKRECLLTCIGGPIENYVYEAILIDVPVAVIMCDEDAMKVEYEPAQKINRRVIASWQGSEEDPDGWVDINWCIFTPKDMERYKGLARTGAELVAAHPEYWFLLPDNNEAHLVLANRLNSYSLLTSLSNQNPLALRAILGASIKGNAVRLEGKRVTMDDFAMAMQTDGPEADLPALFWKPIDKIREALSKMRVYVYSLVKRNVPMKITRVKNFEKPLKVHNQLAVVNATAVSLQNNNRGLVDRARRVAKDENALMADVLAVTSAIGTYSNPTELARKLRRLARTIGSLSGDRYALMGQGYEAMKGGYLRFKLETAAAQLTIKTIAQGELVEALTTGDTTSEREKERQVALAVNIARNREVYPELDEIRIDGKEWTEIVSEVEGVNNLRLNKLLASIKAKEFDDFSLISVLSSGAGEASVRWLRYGNSMTGGTEAEVVSGGCKAVIKTGLLDYVIRIGPGAQTEVDKILQKCKEILRSEGKELKLSKHKPGYWFWSSRYGYYWGLYQEGARVVEGAVLDKGLFADARKRVVKTWIQGFRQMVEFVDGEVATLWSVRSRTGINKDPKNVIFQTGGWSNPDNVGGVRITAIIEDGLLNCLLEDKMPKMGLTHVMNYMSMETTIRGWALKAIEEEGEVVELDLDALTGADDLEMSPFVKRMQHAVAKVGFASALDVAVGKAVCKWYTEQESVSEIVQRHMPEYIAAAFSQPEGELTPAGERAVSSKLKMITATWEYMEDLSEGPVAYYKELNLFE